MRSHLTLLFALFLAVPLCAGELRHVSDPAKGSYIVVLNSDQPAGSANALAGRFASSHGIRLRHQMQSAFVGFSFDGNEAAALAIAANPAVLFVEENGHTHAAAAQSPSPSWGVDRIDQQSLPLDNSFSYDYTGQGVAIYVIDSGVNPVADLQSRIRDNRNFVTVNGSVDPFAYSDCFGHGTRVADLAAGTTYGIAKSATVINYRALDCSNNGLWDDFVAAVNYMTADHQNNHPAEMAVANISIYGGKSGAADLAVEAAVSSGITVVVCAGNDATDACNRSPAHLGKPSEWGAGNTNSLSTITVGATGVAINGIITQPDGAAGYSDIGPCVDLFAPGTFVDAMNANGSVSADWSGTSFSAPLTAGVAALHMQRYAMANSPSAIEGAIISNATPNVITGLPASPASPNLLLWTGVTRRRACCY